METEKLIKELEQIFQDVLKQTKISLNTESTTNDVEGWTSLTNVLLINSIEKKYQIHFKFREIIQLKNIGDWCKAINSKIG